MNKRNLGENSKNRKNKANRVEDEKYGTKTNQKVIK